MEKRKKVLLIGGLVLGGVALAMAAGGDANAAPTEPEPDDDQPEPLPGDVPPGQSTIDLDDIAEGAEDILDSLPQVPLPPPAPPVVKPEPVNPPKAPVPLPALPPELPTFDTMPLPEVPIVLPTPAKPKPPAAPAPTVPPPNVSPIPLPPPNTVQPAPAPKPMAQPTLEMVRALLAKEKSPTGWKSLDEPTVRAWQRYRKLVTDGKFGPGSALALADETGLLPIVRAWPKGTWPEKAVPEFRAKLEAKAMQAEEPRRSHLLAAIDREQGQAFGTPPKPVTVTIEGV